MLFLHRGRQGKRWLHPSIFTQWVHIPRTWHINLTPYCCDTVVSSWMAASPRSTRHCLRVNVAVGRCPTALLAIEVTLSWTWGTSVANDSHVRMTSIGGGSTLLTSPIRLTETYTLLLHWGPHLLGAASSGAFLLEDLGLQQ